MRTFRISGKPATAIVSVISGLLFYGFWTVAAYGAQAYLANPNNSEFFPAVLSGGLLMVCLYWQFAPIVTASMGASLDLKKLLVYPIPHQQLFVVEVLLRLTTCSEMLIVLIGIFVGVARNPELGGIPRIVLALALFVAFNLLLSAGLRNLIERLLLRKRARELMTLVIVTISILPQFLIRSNVRSSTLKNAVPSSIWFPWSAAGRILLNHDLALSFAILAAFTAAAYAFGRWQFARSLRYDGESHRIRPRAETGNRAWIERFYRFPSTFLRDPIAAIVEKELRSLTRTAPFRLIFLMACSFGIILWLPRMLNGRPRGGFMTDNLLPLASAYGVLLLGQVTYFNCFGYERSAAQAWFSLPVPISRTLVAKNLAAAIFIVCEVVLITALGAALRVPITPLKIIENFTVAAIAALYLISFGNITSVRMARPMSPDRMSRNASSRALSALVLITFPLVLSPLALAFWVRAVFESETIFFLLLALAAIFGAILYWVAMGSALSTANLQREKILSALSRGDGPMSGS